MAKGTGCAGQCWRCESNPFPATTSEFSSWMEPNPSHNELQDISLVPSDSMLWLRTTLVYKEGTWTLIEDAVEKADPNRLPNCIVDLDIETVLALAHNYKLSPQQLGLYYGEEAEEGLATSGSKGKCLKRLHHFIASQELLAQNAAATSLESETTRTPSAPSVPQEPIAAERAEHNLTHEPYKAWCEFCVGHRAHQDIHPKQPITTGASVVSYDFGFVSRLPEEEDKLTALFLRDQHTKMMHCVPAEQKAGKSLTHLCTELTRFIVHLGHQSVILRSDREPRRKL